MTDARFAGLPAEAFGFYDDLAGNNTRAWWKQHRDTYESNVREPLTALVEEVAEEFGEPQVYRPYRDTRFSKDKTPIKDHQGAVVMLEDAIGYYVQISARGLMVAGGWYAPQGQQLARFRAAVEAGHAAHVRSLVAGLEKQGWDVETNPLKTRPRGVDPEHPDLDLLRFRCLTAAKHYEPEPWLGTRKVLTTVRTGWRRLTPTLEWLADHVGPATDPGQDPDGDRG